MSDLKGLLNHKGSETTVKQKFEDGSEITIKSPNGSMANGLMGGMIGGNSPTPVADDQTINVTSGEYVVNQPAAQKYADLLEEINNEGRQMLADGGWTNGYNLGGKIKKLHDEGYKAPGQAYAIAKNMGYNQGGQVGELTGNLQQDVQIIQAHPIFKKLNMQAEQFGYNKAELPQMIMQQPQMQQLFDTPEKQMALQQAFATPIANPGYATGGEVEGNLVQDTTTGEWITLEEAIKRRGGGTEGLKPNPAPIPAPNLDTQLKTPTPGTLPNDAHDFSLEKARGLQAGKGFGGANLGAKDYVDQLYSRGKHAVKPVSSGIGDQAYRGSDGNLYFQGPNNSWLDANNNPKPVGVTLQGKASTKDEGDLPSKLQGQANTLDEDIRALDTRQAKITNVLKNIPEDVWSGIFGQSAAGIADLLGNEDEASVWRSQVQDFMSSEAIANLPKGPASDKDIDLVLKGVRGKFDNPENLKQFLAAVQRIYNYQRAYNESKRDYIYDNRSTRGFQPPKYDPKGAHQATEGVINSKSNDKEVDLDLS